MTLLDADETGLVPTELVANTLKVYAVPPVRPVTVIGLVDPPFVIFPGLDVTV